jgi:hypothetical protein
VYISYSPEMWSSKAADHPITWVQQLAELGEHDPSEGEVVVPSEGAAESFVISGESSETSGLGEASLNDPSSLAAARSRALPRCV